jgi:hypothetical protein
MISAPEQLSSSAVTLLLARLQEGESISLIARVLEVSPRAVIKWRDGENLPSEKSAKKILLWLS